MGGAVGLKGSDGPEILAQARALGAVPEAPARAVVALKQLIPLRDQLEIITYPFEMGEQSARACGFNTTVIGSIEKGATTSNDTRTAGLAMLEAGVDLLLFAGGDGTARDIYAAVGDRAAVLGVPAGVKIHSGVYAINPRAAGELASLFLQEKVNRLRSAEVMDIDENAFRQGRVTAELFGYLQIPFEQSMVQGIKAGRAQAEENAVKQIGFYLIDHMEPACLYIIGPGTTTQALTDTLDLPSTLLGVDVVRDKKLVARDVNEQQLLGLLGVEGPAARIIVTVIGGQGYIFGRGNQQISPQVIRRVGPNNIMVIATKEKLASLAGKPLLVDTGDEDLNQTLIGYIRVTTGYGEYVIYKVGY